MTARFSRGFALRRLSTNAARVPLGGQADHSRHPAPCSMSSLECRPSSFGPPTPKGSTARPRSERSFLRRALQLAEQLLFILQTSDRTCPRILNDVPQRHRMAVLQREEPAVEPILLGVGEKVLS